MEAPIKEILKYAIDHEELTTKEAVYTYFSEIVFSLEKDEWNRMTHEQREGFIEFLDDAKRRCPRKGTG